MTKNVTEMKREEAIAQLCELADTGEVCASHLTAIRTILSEGYAPPEWQLVPVEPTLKMLIAGQRAASLGEAYDNMLAEALAELMVAPSVLPNEDAAMPFAPWEGAAAKDKP